MTSIEETISALQAAGQTKLSSHFASLTADSQNALMEQLSKVDFAEIQSAFAKKDQEEADVDFRLLSPPTAIRLQESQPLFATDQAIATGEALLREGKVASILVAGGQGTRLGFDHPKGMFPIGPVSEMTIFQIHFEKLIARRKKYGVNIPLYLMTSPATHEETVRYLRNQNYFNFPAEECTIFCQGTMPAVDDQSGELLLANESSLALSPDGHGGTLAALASCGALDQMKAQGIETIYYFQVDNPLADVCEPLFLGYHRLASSQMSTQVIAKKMPEEKLGVLATLAGKMRMVEYSELPSDLAAEQDDQGNLKFWAGNIAVHAFEVDFLKQMADQAGSLPWHLAHKKVPYLDESDNQVQPESPNAIKFEKFIFDLLPSAKNPLVVEVDPATTFAPVKNADGAAADTPTHVKEAMNSLHRAWLKQCDVEVDESAVVEIAPLFALDSKELSEKVSGQGKITESTFFH